MAADDDILPDDRSLADALRELVSAHGAGARVVRVVGRSANPLSSTFDSEVVTCLLAGGRTVRLLCKYEPTRTWNTWGHRRGVGHEADVYHRVLEPAGVSSPRCYGLHVDMRTGARWLVLEYVNNAEYLDAPQLQRAGAWLGTFHRRAAPLASNPDTDFLIRYDADYYAGWARRTVEFCRLLPDAPGRWLEALCARFVERSEELVLGPTVIHGEFYRKNVLVTRDAVHVVDWESCAVAAGEIDLAMLTEGWPADVVKDAKDEYRRARWPGGTPKMFDERLGLARVYVELRWLGDSPRRTLGDDFWRLAQLRTAGVHVGLV